MAKIQVQLTEKQVQTLNEMAHNRGISMAEIIRRSLVEFIDEASLPGKDELRERAIAAVGSIHSDTTDLSARTDDYLEKIYAE